MSIYPSFPMDIATKHANHCVKLPLALNVYCNFCVSSSFNDHTLMAYRLKVYSFLLYIISILVCSSFCISSSVTYRVTTLFHDIRSFTTLRSRWTGQNFTSTAGMDIFI